MKINGLLGVLVILLAPIGEAEAQGPGSGNRLTPAIPLSTNPGTEGVTRFACGNNNYTVRVGQDAVLNAARTAAQ